MKGFHLSDFLFHSRHPTLKDFLCFPLLVVQKHFSIHQLRINSEVTFAICVGFIRVSLGDWDGRNLRRLL